jgi:hypothetical protein
MSQNGTAAYNPFKRHAVESQPVQAQPTAEAAVVSQPADSEKSTPATNTGNHPFARYESTESRPNPKPEQKPVAARELLHWIQRRWTKPVVSLRDVCVFGPYSIRDKASALKHIEAAWLARRNPGAPT